MSTFSLVKSGQEFLSHVFNSRTLQTIVSSTGFMRADIPLKEDEGVVIEFEVMKMVTRHDYKMTGTAKSLRGLQETVFEDIWSRYVDKRQHGSPSDLLFYHQKSGRWILDEKEFTDLTHRTTGRINLGLRINHIRSSLDGGVTWTKGEKMWSDEELSRFNESK